LDLKKNLSAKKDEKSLNLREKARREKSSGSEREVGVMGITSGITI